MQLEQDSTVEAQPMSADTKNNRIKILYIGGDGRSGSTLLDVLLGKMPQFFSAGEMRWIWKRSFMENQLCGSGEPFKDTQFWVDVVNQAFGGFDQVDAEKIMALKDSVDRLRSIPKFLTPSRQDEAFKQKMAELTPILTRLYRAMKDTSGAEFIVDSSKWPPYAYILNDLPETEVYMVHFVRDSRAGAYSWTRKKKRPEIHWKEQYMPQYKVSESARNWSTGNVGTGMFRRANKNYLFMRYEDFTQNPKGELQRIVNFVGYPDADLSFLQGNTFTPGVAYNVSGNPMRFQKGEVTISYDDEWKQKMSARDKAVVTALTWPLLLRYGYSVNA